MGGGVQLTDADPAATAGEQAIWVFEPTAPVSTYITALVAGDYHAVRAEHRVGDRVVPLGVFCRQSMVDYLDADEIIDVTKRGFDYYLEKFDYPYPFEYDQLFVPEFNAGAMENAGCVTIYEDYVFRSKVTDAAYERRAETLLHELAHMWFGDLADHAVVGRPLAERVVRHPARRCSARLQATRWRQGLDDVREHREVLGIPAGPTAVHHPIVADIKDLEDVQVSFDGITYAKGASVLKQLVAWVGLDNFIAGLRQYSGSTSGATRRWPTCSRSWPRPPAAICPHGRGGWKRPG